MKRIRNNHEKINTKLGLSWR